MTPENTPDNAADLPATVQLESLTDARLRVKEPIEVVIFRDDEGFILAEAMGLNEFGCGDDAAEAFAELQYAVGDLYFSLEADKDRLGSWLQGVWETLQVKIEKR